MVLGASLFDATKAQSLKAMIANHLVLSALVANLELFPRRHEDSKGCGVFLSVLMLEVIF